MVPLQTIQDKAAAVAETAARHAADNDRDARFPRDGIKALGEAGLMGLTIAPEHGGLGHGPVAASHVMATLAQKDASLAMVYMMHLSGVECIKLGDFPDILAAASKGRHLTTLAFSETGSRSHFWAPVSQAKRDGDGVLINAQKSYITSAGEADSYVVTTLSPDSQGPTDSTLYLVDSDADGVSVGTAWNGLGLRGNASSPLHFEDCRVPADRRITAEGGGFDAKLGAVLPIFNLGSASVSLGICRAAVAATTQHLQNARFEHLDASLGEALPTLRANLAQMAMKTSALEEYVKAAAASLEAPDETTQARVLQVKALGNETALEVARLAMRSCGGAAYAKNVAVERNFRDAQAGAVMAPTADVLYDLLAKAHLGLDLF